MPQLSDEDFHIIRDRMLPHLSRRGKQRTKDTVLAFLAQLWPRRLEFELMRLRGLAFDAGECGCSYSKEDIHQCMKTTKTPA